MKHNCWYGWCGCTVWPLASYGVPVGRCGRCGNRPIHVGSDPETREQVTARLHADIANGATFEWDEDGEPL